MSNRRNFIKKSGVGLLVAGVSPFYLKHGRDESLDSHSYRKTGQLKIGMAGYTFIKFTIDQTLEMMQKINVHFLCIKDFHLPMNSTEDEVAAFLAKLANRNISGYAVGPINMDTKAKADECFRYAKALGVNLIIGVPEPALLPYIDEKVKEYDIRYAVHNHGPDMKLYPDALNIISHIKDLDPRIGICLDIGHDARFGSDPVIDLKKYSNRIFDIHIKDVTASNKEGVSCEIGRGILNIPAIVCALKYINYNGICSLEHEKDMDNPIAGIAESIGYFRGVMAVV